MTSNITTQTLVLHQVSMHYPDGQNADGTPRTITALDRVDFLAETGQLTALVGESGSGKSTLLSIIGGLVRPTDGSVNVAGQHIERFTTAEQAQLRRDTVGLIFQQPNLLAALSVQDQLLVTDHLRGLRGAALKKRRTRAHELLDIVGLGELADRKLHALSGGQRQRVNIARALMGSPKVLLADEPTSALDQSRSHQIMELLTSITKQFGLTTVVVTHNRGLLTYTNQQVTLSDGAVTARKNLRENIQ